MLPATPANNRPQAKDIVEMLCTSFGLELLAKLSSKE
jgi:hypothetical protein